MPSPKIFTDGTVVFTGENGRIKEAISIFLNKSSNFFHVSGDNQCKMPSNITCDFARNTKENIALTKLWIEKNNIQSLRLITSDYHMPRALLFARSLEVKILPHPLHINLNSSKRIYRIFKEYNKWLLSFVIHMFECIP